MTEMVLDVKMVPDAIFSHIKTEKVNFHAENGTIVLTPVVIEKEKTFDRLIGMFSDGTLSVDGFLSEKRGDKQLEEELPEIETVEIPVVKKMVFQFKKSVKLNFS